MRCTVCGAEGTAFRRGRRASGEVVHLCPACYKREEGALAPTGEGCACLPAPLPPE